MCWDIYLEACFKKAELSKEIDALARIMVKNEWRSPSTFIENALVWENAVVVVTDINANIVFSSQNIIKMTGYHAKEIIGKKPTIFQGEETETDQKENIKTSIIKQTPFEAMITNYKKNGQTYKCHIQGYPMFNRFGNLVNFVAIEKAA